ncbi:hypothetical protein SAY86_028985 [Trapa natans]|uniref:AT-hook motif nuclear-localized protein n=1 Tax=Trapa natans TaxID=22666 RepID=A0AAN7M1I2_TRANT|nr:hypothetical protein SAY86_028985 [Trapa natans]
MDRRDSTAYYNPPRGLSGAQPLNHPAGMQFQSNFTASSLASALQQEPASGFSGGNVSVPSFVPPTSQTQCEPLKRKRGRPRKYGTDGSVSLALSSASISPSSGSLGPTQKRGRGRPPGSGRKQQLASFGEFLSGSAGMGFTPHIITVATGEDVATKIMAFSQQGSRAMCILSAMGSVSTVTLRQSSSSGSCITYEGRFEILSLSGSYIITDNSGSHNQSGGLSISLASPDGRVIGGGVGGLLIAASPVQVIMGSFSRGSSKMKRKKVVGSEGTEASDNSLIGSLTPTPTPLSQNLTPLPMGVWRDSQPSDLDIDLMRG